MIGTRNRDKISLTDELASFPFQHPSIVLFSFKNFHSIARTFNAPSTRFYVRSLRAISILILLTLLGKVSELLHQISP